jgi:hypothetical protein
MKVAGEKRAWIKTGCTPCGSFSARKYICPRDIIQAGPIKPERLLEKKKEGKRREDPGKKKAFAFFYIEIIVSFFSLFSFVLQKAAIPLFIFMAGIAAHRLWWFC